MEETVEEILNDLICFEDPDTMLTISVDADKTIVVVSNDGNRIARGHTLHDALIRFRWIARPGRLSSISPRLTMSTLGVGEAGGETPSVSDRMARERKSSTSSDSGSGNGPTSWPAQDSNSKGRN
jgi:hypothetical protein